MRLTSYLSSSRDDWQSYLTVLESHTKCLCIWGEIPYRQFYYSHLQQCPTTMICIGTALRCVGTTQHLPKGYAPTPRIGKKTEEASCIHVQSTPHTCSTRLRNSSSSFISGGVSPINRAKTSSAEAERFTSLSATDTSLGSFTSFWL